MKNMNFSCLPWHKKNFTEWLINFQKRPINSWFIYGKHGIGKFNFVMSISARIFCKNYDNFFACGKCNSCTLIRSNNHPDLKILSPQSLNLESLYISYYGNNINESISEEICIDQIRTLENWFYNSTYITDSYKILIIYPANKLNIISANSILKILEDTNNKILFFIISNNIYEIVPTIISRCSRILLPTPSYQETKIWLNNHNMVKNVDDWIAFHSGSPLHIFLDMKNNINTYEDFICNLMQLLISEEANNYDLFLSYFEKFGANKCISILQKLFFDLIQVHYHSEIRYFPKQKDMIFAIGNKYSLDNFFNIWYWLYDKKKLLSSNKNLNIKVLAFAALKHILKMNFIS